MTKKFNLIIPESARHLEGMREVFYLLRTDAEAQSASDWIIQHFPIASWGRINWEKVQKCMIKSWHHQDDLLLLYFKEIIETEQLKGHVTVSWSNALTMPIYLDIKLVLKYAPTILLEEYPDTWIFSAEDNWCLEVYHEGEICFGYSALTSERE